MSGQVTVAIDHVIVYGRQPGFLKELFDKLGFASPDGKYYMFRKNYLEYLVPGQGISATEGKKYEFFPGPAGLHSLIFWTDDADRSYAALKGAGVSLPAPVMEFSRPAFVDGQEKTARFRGTMAPPLFPYSETMLVNHLTPELVYLPGGGAHPNGVDSLEELYLCLPTAEAREAALQTLQRVGGLIQGEAPLHDCLNQVSVYSEAEIGETFGLAPDTARSSVCGVRFSCRDYEKVKAAALQSGFGCAQRAGGLVVDLMKELNLFLYFKA